MFPYFAAAFPCTTTAVAFPLQHAHTHLQLHYAAHLVQQFLRAMLQHVMAQIKFILVYKICFFPFNFFFFSFFVYLLLPSSCYCTVISACLALLQLFRCARVEYFWAAISIVL